MFDWNDLRYFLAVARSGSTLSASRNMKVSQATISRRVTILEEAIGGKSQWKKLEEMRMEKMLGDNEYIKSLMDGLERKVKNEMGKRLSSEFDQKQWLEMQFHGFKDEIVK